MCTYRIEHRIDSKSRKSCAPAQLETVGLTGCIQKKENMHVTLGEPLEQFLSQISEVPFQKT
jgi:Na+-translocating ferredoxin:NAD+ oxidoreductase RnfC subunit